MVAFIQLIGKGAEKRTRYNQNIMNVKVKMAGGGWGHVSGFGAGHVPPPHNTGQLLWQTALCRGGGGGRGEQWIEIKKLDIKNTLLLLPPSLSNGASLVQNSKFN